MGLTYQVHDDLVPADVLVVDLDAGDPRGNLAQHDLLELESGEAVAVERALHGRLHGLGDDLAGVVTHVGPQLVQDGVDPLRPFL